MKFRYIIICFIIYIHKFISATHGGLAKNEVSSNYVDEDSNSNEENHINLNNKINKNKIEIISGKKFQTVKKIRTPVIYVKNLKKPGYKLRSTNEDKNKNKLDSNLRKENASINSIRRFNSMDRAFNEYGFDINLVEDDNSNKKRLISKNKIIDPEKRNERSRAERLLNSSKKANSFIISTISWRELSELLKQKKETNRLIKNFPSNKNLSNRLLHGEMLLLKNNSGNGNESSRAQLRKHGYGNSQLFEKNLNISTTMKLQNSTVRQVHKNSTKSKSEPVFYNKKITAISSEIEKTLKNRGSNKNFKNVLKKVSSIIKITQPPTVGNSSNIKVNQETLKELSKKLEIINPKFINSLSKEFERIFRSFGNTIRVISQLEAATATKEKLVLPNGQTKSVTRLCSRKTPNGNLGSLNQTATIYEITLKPVVFSTGTKLETRSSSDSPNTTGTSLPLNETTLTDETESKLVTPATGTISETILSSDFPKPIEITLGKLNETIRTDETESKSDIQLSGTKLASKLCPASQRTPKAMLGNFNQTALSYETDSKSDTLSGESSTVLSIKFASSPKNVCKLTTLTSSKNTTISLETTILLPMITETPLQTLVFPTTEKDNKVQVSSESNKVEIIPELNVSTSKTEKPTLKCCPKKYHKVSFYNQSAFKRYENKNFDQLITKIDIIRQTSVKKRFKTPTRSIDDDRKTTRIISLGWKEKRLTNTLIKLLKIKSKPTEPNYKNGKSTMALDFPGLVESLETEQPADISSVSRELNEEPTTFLVETVKIMHPLKMKPLGKEVFDFTKQKRRDYINLTKNIREDINLSRPLSIRNKLPLGSPNATEFAVPWDQKTNNLINRTHDGFVSQQKLSKNPKMWVKFKLCDLQTPLPTTGLKHEVINLDIKHSRPNTSEVLPGKSVKIIKMNIGGNRDRIIDIRRIIKDKIILDKDQDAKNQINDTNDKITVKAKSNYTKQGDLSSLLSNQNIPKINYNTNKTTNLSNSFVGSEINKINVKPQLQGNRNGSNEGSRQIFANYKGNPNLQKIDNSSKTIWPVKSRNMKETYLILNSTNLRNSSKNVISPEFIFIKNNQKNSQNVYQDLYQKPFLKVNSSNKSYSLIAEVKGLGTNHWAMPINQSTLIILLYKPETKITPSYVDPAQNTSALNLDSNLSVSKTTAEEASDLNQMKTIFGPLNLNTNLSTSKTVEETFGLNEMTTGPVGDQPEPTIPLYSPSCYNQTCVTLNCHTQCGLLNSIKLKDPNGSRVETNITTFPANWFYKEADLEELHWKSSKNLDENCGKGISCSTCIDDDKLDETDAPQTKLNVQTKSQVTPSVTSNDDGHISITSRVDKSITTTENIVSNRASPLESIGTNRCYVKPTECIDNKNPVQITTIIEGKSSCRCYPNKTETNPNCGITSRWISVSNYIKQLTNNAKVCITNKTTEESISKGNICNNVNVSSRSTKTPSVLCVSTNFYSFLITLNQTSCKPSEVELVSVAGNASSATPGMGTTKSGSIAVDVPKSMTEDNLVSPSSMSHESFDTTTVKNDSMTRDIPTTEPNLISTTNASQDVFEMVTLNKLDENITATRDRIEMNPPKNKCSSSTTATGKCITTNHVFPPSNDACSKVTGQSLELVFDGKTISSIPKKMFQPVTIKSKEKFDRITPFTKSGVIALAPKKPSETTLIFSVGKDSTRKKQLFIKVKGNDQDFIQSFPKVVQIFGGEKYMKRVLGTVNSGPLKEILVDLNIGDGVNVNGSLKCVY